MHKDLIIHKTPQIGSVTNTIYLFLYRMLLQASSVPGRQWECNDKAERALSLRFLSCVSRQITTFWSDKKFGRRLLEGRCLNEEVSELRAKWWEGTSHKQKKQVAQRWKPESESSLTSHLARDVTWLLRGFGTKTGKLHSCSQLSLVLSCPASDYSPSQAISICTLLVSTDVFYWTILF